MHRWLGWGLVLTSLGAASCSDVLRPTAPRCPLDVIGPAVAVQCYPGNFRMRRVTSNERGLLVEVTASQRVDFGGLVVVEAGTDALVFFDDAGTARWKTEVRCGDYGCPSALGHDGSAAVFSGRLLWLRPNAPPLSLSIAERNDDVLGIALPRDGSVLYVIQKTNPADDGTGNVVLVVRRMFANGRVEQLSSAAFAMSPNYRHGADLALDESGELWAGAGGIQPDMLAITPRGTFRIPLAPRGLSIRGFPVGAFVRADEAGCTGGAMESPQAFALLSGAGVTWKRCVHTQATIIFDVAPMGDGVVVAGGMGPGAMFEGDRINGSLEGSAFIGALGAAGGLQRIVRIESADVTSSVVRVQPLPDGSVLAFGLFADRRKDEGPSAERPFAAPRRDGAFIVRTR